VKALFKKGGFICCMLPSEEKLKQNTEKRGQCFESLKSNFTVLGIPSVSEGFSHVYIVDETGIKKRPEEEQSQNSNLQNSNLQND
jgi:hypothetical protein